MNRLLSILAILILICLPYSVFSQGIWKTYTTADGLPSDRIGAVIQDNFGNYLFTTSKGLTTLDTNGIWSTYWCGDTASLSSIVIDSLNNKWLRVTQLKGYYFGNYVVKFDDSSFTYYSPTGHPEPQYEPHLGWLTIDAEGHIWCGTTHALAYWFDGTVWHPHFVPGAWKYMSPIYQIVTDRHGKLYFAHYRGIATLDEYIFDGGRMFGTMTHSIAFDRQNRMWFGCTHDKYALGMFDGQNWHGFTTTDGLKQNDVVWVAVDSSNNIWMTYGSVPSGVSRFDGQCFTHYTQKDGLGHDIVHQIYVDIKGNVWFTTDGGVSVFKDTTTSAKVKLARAYQPIKFSLFQNYPNPFNSITTLKYDLPFEGRIQLSIYDLMGKEVINLIHEKQAAGLHQVVWNGNDNNGKEVSSGIYLAVLKSTSVKKSIKLILVR
jgi:ligand-binding sensor domain-containing protein